MVNKFDSMCSKKKKKIITVFSLNTIDYIRDASKSKDVLKAKYSNLVSILNQIKQGNLSSNEKVGLYTQARRLVKMSYSSLL